MTTARPGPAADGVGAGGPARSGSARIGPGAAPGEASPRAGAGHDAALWVCDEDRFLGSAFHLGGGLVVTAAHVVAGHAVLSVAHATGTYPVTAVRASPDAPEARRTRFRAPPDLAVLTVPGCAGLPGVRLAAADPAQGLDVTGPGYSTQTPEPGVRPHTLSLRVGGPSAAFLRVLGDRVHEGLSGTMLAGADGLVVGVLKGSRSYQDAQGGWFTPVSALREFLGDQAPDARDTPAAPDAPAPATTPAAPAPPPPPGDAEIVDALLAFPALARADLRYDLLERMGDHLGLPYSFEAEERSARRDHLYRIVLSCRHFRDERAALRSLYTAMEEIVPYDRALDRLRELVGRAVGGWEDA